MAAVLLDCGLLLALLFRLGGLSIASEVAEVEDCSAREDASVLLLLLEPLPEG